MKFINKKANKVQNIKWKLFNEINRMEIDIYFTCSVVSLNELIPRSNNVTT